MDEKPTPDDFSYNNILGWIDMGGISSYR